MKKKIDPYKNFKLISKDCFELFILGRKERNDKTLPVKFGKGKYIITLDPGTFENFYIAFKDKIKKKYFEILIIFDEVKEGKKNIIDEFTLKDINEWLKEMNFDLLSDCKKHYEKQNCKFTIFNKTLNFIYEKKASRNTVIPNNPNLRYLLSNSKDEISGNSIELIKQTMLLSMNQTCMISNENNILKKINESTKNNNSEKNDKNNINNENINTNNDNVAKQEIENKEKNENINPTIKENKDNNVNDIKNEKNINDKHSDKKLIIENTNNIAESKNSRPSLQSLGICLRWRHPHGFGCCSPVR